MRLVNGGPGNDGESMFAVFLSSVVWHEMAEGSPKWAFWNCIVFMGMDIQRVEMCIGG
jgi:hypothetical protein